MADLTVFALGQRQAHPRRRDAFAVPDRRVAVGQIRRNGQDFGLARLGFVSLDRDAIFQPFDRVGRDLPVHLRQIGTGVREFRVEQFFDQTSVVGQQNQTFAVVIQPARRVHVRRQGKSVQSRVSAFGRELA